MGSETDKPIETVTIRKSNCDSIIEVLRLVQTNSRLTFEERKALKAKADRCLKALIGSGAVSS